jgi:hypothetical protein
MSTSDLNAFQQWVADMAEGAGIELPAPLDPMGLELEVDGRMARVMAHSDDSLAVVEVDVRSLNEVDDAHLGAVGLALLRLNQEARFEHGWAIVLDEDDLLSISTTVVMAQTASQALNEIISEGLDRAASLQEAVAGMIDPAVAALRAQESGSEIDDFAGNSAIGSAGFIRG